MSQAAEAGVSVQMHSRDGGLDGPVWEVVTEHGASARISATGGQLLSWQPVEGQEVFWCTPAPLPAPAPLRGGVPLCWPWFGRQGQPPTAPAHGLARTAPWCCHRQQVLADGRVELALRPLQALHPALEVEQVLRIGATLEQELRTRNHGNQPLPLSQALHSYFRVDALQAVQVDGLHGPFHDALQPDSPGFQQGPWRFAADRGGGRCDRIHPYSGSALRLHRGGQLRPLQLTATGATSLVLWTPGSVLGPAMADVGSHWDRFVCLEVANAGEGALQLAPGQQCLLGQQLAVID